MLTERIKCLLSKKGSWPFACFWLAGVGVLIGRACFDAKTYFFGSTLEYRCVESGDYGYLLHLPPGYTDFENPRPLIVFLHGAGETNKGLGVLEKCDLWHYTKGHVNTEEFPFIVVSPMTPKHGWEPKLVKRLSEQIVHDHSKRYRIDPNRIYLTGFSMGGVGVFHTAHAYPKTFAAIMPVAGGCEPDMAERLKNVPTWAFHGDADEVVPFECSSKMIDAMRTVGCVEAKLTSLKGKGHGIVQDVYTQPEIYQWMLDNRTHNR